jgi:hypothetical protein
VKRFLHRCRQWHRALTAILMDDCDARVRVELVLEIRVNPDDDLAIRALRCYLPGWSVQQRGDDRVRLVPPAYVEAGE